MSKHTPGPWIAGQPSSVVGWPVVASGTGRLICDMIYVQRTKIDRAVDGDKAFNAESGANARLIATAPDMIALINEAPRPSAFAGEDDIDWEAFNAAYEDWLNRRLHVLLKVEGK